MVVVWKDKYRNNLTEKDISDRYLKNIIKHVEKGGGYQFFVTKAVIDKLFDMADKRNINHEYSKGLALKNMRLKQKEVYVIS